MIPEAEILYSLVYSKLLLAFSKSTGPVRRKSHSLPSNLCAILKQKSSGCVYAHMTYNRWPKPTAMYGLARNIDRSEYNNETIWRICSMQCNILFNPYTVTIFSWTLLRYVRRQLSSQYRLSSVTLVHPILRCWTFPRYFAPHVCSLAICLGCALKYSHLFSRGWGVVMHRTVWKNRDFLPIQVYLALCGKQYKIWPSLGLQRKMNLHAIYRMVPFLSLSALHY